MSKRLRESTFTKEPKQLFFEATRRAKFRIVQLQSLPQFPLELSPNTLSSFSLVLWQSFVSLNYPHESRGSYSYLSSYVPFLKTWTNSDDR